MSNIGKTVLLCVGFITAVLVIFVYSVTAAPELSIDELREKGVFVLPKPRDIAQFELQDHNGDLFNRESLNGKWTFVFFGFTHCPDICPTTMAQMGLADQQIQALGGELAEGFRGVLITVDPERDSAEILGKYTKAFSERFIGLRGEIAATGLLAQQVNTAFGKVPDGQGGYTLDHSGHIVVINPHGHYHGFVKMPHDAETISLAYQSLAAQF